MVFGELTDAFLDCGCELRKFRLSEQRFELANIQIFFNVHFPERPLSFDEENIQLQGEKLEILIALVNDAEAFLGLLDVLFDLSARIVHNLL